MEGISSLPAQSASYGGGGSEVLFSLSSGGSRRGPEQTQAGIVDFGDLSNPGGSPDGALPVGKIRNAYRPGSVVTVRYI